MELLEFIKSLSPDELDGFAVEVGTTLPHLRNVAYGARVASAALAAQIQVKSRGLVQVSTLRPKDWHLVWGDDVNQTMNLRPILADRSDCGLSFVTGVAQQGEVGHDSSVGGKGGAGHPNEQGAVV